MLSALGVAVRLSLERSSGSTMELLVSVPEGWSFEPLLLQAVILTIIISVKSFMVFDFMILVFLRFRDNYAINAFFAAEAQRIDNKSV